MSQDDLWKKRGYKPEFKKVSGFGVRPNQATDYETNPLEQIKINNDEMKSLIKKYKKLKKYSKSTLHELVKLHNKEDEITKLLKEYQENPEFSENFEEE